MAESILSVMQPVVMTDSVLTSTTVPETDFAQWSSLTTYAAGARVIHLTTHRIYESAQAGNLDKDPTDINNRVGSAIWWIDVSATEAWKMFDGEVGTPTIATSPLTIVAEPGFISSIAMLGIIADTVVIDMLDMPGGTNVFSRTIILENSQPPDYYEYFFSPFEQQPSFVISDLPPFDSAELTVTLTNATASVRCGMMQLGDLRPLGSTQFGAKASPKTFSFIKINDFGENEIVRRKSARDVSVKAILDISQANTTVSILTSVLDQAVIWVATEIPEYSGLTAFGLGNGTVDYDNFGRAVLTVNIKGLI